MVDLCPMKRILQGVGVFVFHFQLNNTQGAVTLTRFIMIDLFGRIETFTSIEQKPQYTGNSYLNRCLSRRAGPCFCLPRCRVIMYLPPPKHRAPLHSGQFTGPSGHKHLTLQEQKPLKCVFKSSNRKRTRHKSTFSSVHF